jgi:hypothetical protein
MLTLAGIAPGVAGVTLTFAAHGRSVGVAGNRVDAQSVSWQFGSDLMAGAASR